MKKDGIPETYAEVWQIFSTKHGDNADTRRIHNKWKEIARSCGVKN